MKRKYIYNFYFCENIADAADITTGSICFAFVLTETLKFSESGVNSATKNALPIAN